MRPRHGRVECRRIKRLLGFPQIAVDLRVRVVVPVGPARRGIVGEEAAQERTRRLLRGIGEIDGADPGRGRRLRTVAVGREQGDEIYHLEFNVDADIGEVCLDELVHRQRLHLPTAAVRDQHLCLDALLPSETGFGEQALCFSRIIANIEARPAEPWRARLDQPLGRDCRAVERLYQSLTVDREVRGTTHPQVPERRIRQRAQPPAPHVRIEIADHIEAGRAQAFDGVGRHRFNEVNLPCPERRDPRGGIRYRQQRHGRHAWAPACVPVIGVARQVEPRPRHELGDAERSGA